MYVVSFAPFLIILDKNLAPIVTTTTGGSGLSLKDNINAFITDDPSRFANRVLDLLNHPKLAQQMSQAVAETYTKQYSHCAIYSKLDQLFGIVPSYI